MKRTRIFIALLSIVGVLLASVTFAAQTEGTATRGVTAEGARVHKASTFIGSRVTSPKGESLGTITDIVLDPEDGRIKYAALSYGGVLGLGGKLFAVAWDALTLQSDGKTFLLNVDQELLEATPGFDRNNWPQRPDPMLQAAVRPPAGSKSAGIDTRAERSAASIPASRTELMMSATIEDLDAQQGTISLKTEAGEIIDLMAPAALLVGLQAGDVVEVSSAGNQVTTIHKRDAQ
jgi:sporulation protein YlmC with PRC-barrel domain